MIMNNKFVYKSTILLWYFYDFSHIRIIYTGIWKYTYQFIGHECMLIDFVHKNSNLTFIILSISLNLFNWRMWKMFLAFPLRCLKIHQMNTKTTKNIYQENAIKAAEHLQWTQMEINLYLIVLKICFHMFLS